MCQVLAGFSLGCVAPKFLKSHMRTPEIIIKNEVSCLVVDAGGKYLVRRRQKTQKRKNTLSAIRVEGNTPSTFFLWYIDLHLLDYSSQHNRWFGKYIWVLVVCGIERACRVLSTMPLFFC